MRGVWGGGGSGVVVVGGELNTCQRPGSETAPKLNDAR